MDYSSLKLLFKHTNQEALQAVLGKHYLFWMLPLLLIIIGGIIYCCTVTWRTAGKSSRKLSRRSLIVFSVFLALSIASNITFYILKKYSPANFITVRPLPLLVFNLTHDTIVDVYRRFNHTPIPLPPESRAELEKMEIIDPLNAPKASGKDLFDRIIVIAVESLDYDYLSRNNPAMPAGITPNLDALSEKYISMDNYFCAAQPTSWGLTAMMLSRVDYELDRYITPPSLFTQAKKRGFHTFYFSSAPGYFDNNSKDYKIMFSPDTQFFREEFFKIYDFGVENEWGLSDKTLFSGVLQELQKTPHERFIAFISTIDTHPPYHHSPLKSEEEERFPTPFLQALYSTDRELNTFINAIINDKKLYNDRTLIIVTADHTATHGENYTKRSDFSPGRIPLIFITPNRKIFLAIDTKKYASSIDLPPTLLYLIGGEIPDSFMGRNLFSPKNSAICKLLNGTLQIHSPHGMHSVNLNETSTDKTDKVWIDYYRSFYGK